MTDKVQKIREEVERLMSELIQEKKKGFGSDVDDAYILELQNVLTYIDSLQEEPVIEDWLDMSKIDCKIQYANIESGIHAHAEDYSFNIESQLFNQLTKEQQELWRKEIEQAVISGGHCGVELARDKRYKENQEPVSDDLEEASKEWLSPQLDKSYANYGEAKMMELTHFDGYAMLDAIEFGAKWGKEQAKVEIQAQSMAFAHGCPKEEPISEELDSYIKANFTIDKEQLDRFGIEEKDYMYSMDKSDMEKMVRYFTGNYKIPVSDDLEEAAKLYVSDSLCITGEEDWDDAAIEALDAYKAGAQWQEEKDKSVTKDLGDYINELSKQFPEVSFAKLSRIAIRVAKWQKENLWKPADGDGLPEIGREIVAFQADFPNLFRIVVAHRPNPEGYDGKSIATGVVEHYTPKTYGEGGWNIPDVKYWLDVELPKEIEL